MTRSCFSGGPSIVIVTGANQGYGFQLAMQALNHVTERSVIVLVGRNADGLTTAREKILAAVGEREVRVRYVVSDLSVPEQVSHAAEQVMEGHDLARFKNLFLFNNAATIGDVTKSFDSLTDANELRDYFNLNVNGCMLLTSHILQRTKSLTQHVINISSFMASEPRVGCSLYCTGKAARDMMFRVLAAERPDVRVLNWAPGAMPTRMFKQSMLNTQATQMVDSLKKMLANKTYVECSDSANKLMALLVDNSFASGSHIDYSDV